MAEGLLDGAHPTAPGGMSEAALRVELAERHGVTMDESRGMTWPEKIDAVAAGRRREEEAGRCDLCGRTGHEFEGQCLL